MEEASRNAIERFHATIKVSFFVFKILSRVMVTTEVLYSKCNAFAVIKARQQPSVILIAFIIFILNIVLLLTICL